MPLKGMSKSEKVQEILHSYEKTGKIGKIRPKNKQHARRIAVAIAYGKDKNV